MMIASSKQFFGILFLLTITSTTLYPQCETWIGKPNQEDITTWHSVYRPYIKSEDYASAFQYWERAYKAAPAADGQRDFHYTDGIKIYLDKFQKETDAAKKEEYSAHILRLYDEAIDCYKNKGIKRKCMTDECYKQYISTLYGRKGYDMYYTLRSPYVDVLQTFENAIEIGGNDTEYTVIAPMASVAVYQYQDKVIDAAKAREIHDKLMTICKDKTESTHKYAAYYDQAQGAMVGEFAKIKYDIFDCEYHKEDNMQEYEANESNPAYAKDLYNKLKLLGCDPGDPFMKELEVKWSTYAAQVNAERQAEFEANNPGILAKKAYDAGDFDGAIAKYRSAIGDEMDPIQKASYHFSIASILFRKLNRYSDARSEALKSAELNPESGRPYVLLGDMYSTAARNCGDSWDQSMAVLAALEKWGYAKTKDLDPVSLESVNKKINTYQRSKPAKEDGFMQGIKPGSKQRVNCWIGETVTVSYR
jgi:hypothetical protein